MMSVYKDKIEHFKKLAANNKLSHAYLFFGEGLGEEKFVFARSLANFLENGKFGVPERMLGEELVVSPNEKGSIGIDDIRRLKQFLWQKTSSEKQTRTAIIKGAENMTSEAQNSALKIVEEPPVHSLIIFIANNESNLTPALSSRLQKIYFPALSNKEETKTAGDILDLDISEEEINLFFNDLIGRLAKNPVKNFQKLKAALRRLAFIKQFNVNKRLQLKTLICPDSEAAIN